MKRMAPCWLAVLACLAAVGTGGVRAASDNPAPNGAGAANGALEPQPSAIPGATRASTRRGSDASIASASDSRSSSTASARRASIP